MATLSDYKDQRPPPEGKDAEQFFAGGSEHSGQMIEGPPPKNQKPENITQSFIDAAKKYVMNTTTGYDVMCVQVCVLLLCVSNISQLPSTSWCTGSTARQTFFKVDCNFYYKDALIGKCVVNWK